MARGFVSVDWILGIAIFTVFTAFGIVYFVNIAPSPESPLQDVTGLIAEKVLDYIQVDVYQVPLIYNSSGPETDAVLYFDFTWPSGTRNSTRVFADGTELPCIIQGDRFYWQANLTAGVNTFRIKMSNQTTSMRCTGTFSTAGARRVIPFSLEKEKMISQARLNQMVSTNYGSFKTAQGINRDFQVALNVSGNLITYGATPLNATNVYVKEKWKRIEENGQPVNIIIKVW